MHHTSGTVESRLRTPPTRLRLRNPTGHHAISSHRQPSALDCASPPDWRSSHSTTRPPAARAAHHPAAGSTRCTPPSHQQHESRITRQSAGQDCRLQAASRFQSGTAVRQSTGVRSAGSWLPVHARAGGQRNGCHILIPVLFTGRAARGIAARRRPRVHYIYSPGAAADPRGVARARARAPAAYVVVWPG